MNKYIEQWKSKDTSTLERIAIVLLGVFMIALLLSIFSIVFSFTLGNSCVGNTHISGRILVTYAPSDDYIIWAYKTSVLWFKIGIGSIVMCIGSFFGIFGVCELDKKRRVCK